MKKCPKCGSNLKANQKFCTKCGTKIEDLKKNKLSPDILAKIDILQKKILNDNLNTTLYFELGDVYFSNEIYDEAILEYQKSISIDESNFNANLKAGIVYRKLKKNENAETIKLSSDIDDEFKTLEFHIALKTAYITLNKIEAAFKKMIEIEKIDPENIHNLKDLAKYFYEKNELDKYFELHKRILTIESDNITSRFIIGKEAFFNNDYKKTMNMI